MSCLVDGLTDPTKQYRKAGRLSVNWAASNEGATAASDDLPCMARKLIHLQERLAGDYFAGIEGLSSFLEGKSYLQGKIAITDFGIADSCGGLRQVPTRARASKVRD